MLTSGDVVPVDLGLPAGNEAGFNRPAVVVTAQDILDESAMIVQVVPLTSSIRGFASDVAIEATSINGLSNLSSAQCHQIRAVSTIRLGPRLGNVGATDLTAIRETVGIILDIPLR